MEKTGKKFFLLMAGVSIVLVVAIFYFVWSGAYTSLIKFKRWFIPVGILLILMSLLLVKKAYMDIKLPHRVRLLFLFGPGVSGGLAGLAAISYGVVSTGLWWVPLLLAILSFVAFQIAFILAIVLARDHHRSSEVANPAE